ncbi:transposase [Arthrobacter sp. V4I6]|nr:transposase [Arthrobacter sp. V1I7]MDQ0854669.1 transposase [Arthrobacter sp. V4I6]
MPKPFPAEFRRDVVAVARKDEAPVSQIAKDFGISEATLHNWLKKADIEEGARPGVTEKEAAELRDARKLIRCWSRRMRSCAGRRRSSPGSCPKKSSR